MGGEKAWCKKCDALKVSHIDVTGKGYPLDCPLDMVNLEKGYWRQDPGTRLIISCPAVQACVGGTMADKQCNTGHKQGSVLCQVCDDGWTLKDDICYPCKSTASSIHKFSAIVIGIAAVIGIVYHIHSRHSGSYQGASEAPIDEEGQTADGGTLEGAVLMEEPEPQTTEGTRTEEGEDTRQATDEEGQHDVLENQDGASWTMPVYVLALKDMIGRKFKLVATFYQIVTAIPKSYPVKFALEFENIASYFGIVNLDIKDIFLVDCYDVGIDYYESYMVKVFIPVFVSVLCYCAHLYYGEGSKSGILVKKLYLLYLFCIYPSMCATGGETMRCLQTSDDDADLRHWLKADLTIDCGSEALQNFVVVDVVCMILYPVGIPLFFFLALWPHREDLLLPRIDGPMVMPTHLAHLEPLCRTYEPRCWWYELLELARKYILVAVCTSVFRNHPSSAMLSAIVVCMAYLLLFQRLSPFVYDIDDTICYVSLCILTLIFMMALLTRSSNLLKDATSQSAVEQKEVYGFEALIVFAAVLVVFVVVFALVIAILEGWILISDPKADLVHYDFCGTWQASPPKDQVTLQQLSVDMPPLPDSSRTINLE